MSEEYNFLLNEIKVMRREIANLTSLAGPFGVYLGDGTVLTQTSTGLRFYVYADDQILLPKLIGNRVWEPSVTRHLQRTIQQDNHFIDVGANIGYFSCLAASLLDRSVAEVYAFEPNPRALTLLQRNISINWSIARIHVEACALSDSEGEIPFYAPHRLIGNASLYDMRSDEEDSEKDTVEVINVKTKRLDDIIREKDRIGTIKIDVEGAEYDVLAGAEEILHESQSCEIVMEWSTSQLKRASQGVDDLLSLFDNYGFAVREIGKTGEPISLSDLEKIDYTNIFLKRS